MSEVITTPDQLEGGSASVRLDAAPMPADLDGAVEAHEAYHDGLALKELDGSDRMLHPIRTSVRPSVEPVLAEFDAQLASVKNQVRAPGMTADEMRDLTGQGRLSAAGSETSPDHQEWLALQAHIAQRGTLTGHGFAKAKADIAAKRKAALDDAFGKVRVRLDEAEASVRRQQAETRPKPKDEDVQAAIGLMVQLGMTNPAHGSPILAEFVADAARAMDAPRAAAALPMLKSLYETEGPWRGSPELLGLIGKAERVSRTWQGTVTAARLERIKRTRHDLNQYEQEVAEGVSYEVEGVPRLFPEEPEPVRREPPPKERKPVRILRSKGA